MHSIGMRDSEEGTTNLAEARAIQPSDWEHHTQAPKGCDK